jgi:hypothetical protein
MGLELRFRVRVRVRVRVNVRVKVRVNFRVRVRFKVGILFIARPLPYTSRLLRKYNGRISAFGCWLCLFCLENIQRMINISVKQRDELSKTILDRVYIQKRINEIDNRP